jgi:hypothetical protein
MFTAEAPRRREETRKNKPIQGRRPSLGNLRIQRKLTSAPSALSSLAFSFVHPRRLGASAVK